MENKPLVSILIACYNGQKYIDKCLNSCISQTYDNLEIIVINDGSIDNSFDILKQWTVKNKKIKVINQVNCGLGETRNRLIKNANGQYFFFLDIDDTIPKNAIEVLIKNTNDGKNDIVAARSKLVYKNKLFKIPFLPSWRYTRNMTNGHYVKSNICTPWGCIIKKDYYESLEIKFIPGKIFEDIGVMTYVYLKSNNFKSINKVVYFYHKYKKDKNDEKQLSSFKTITFKKNDDVYYQVEQLIQYLKTIDTYNDKKFKRYMNGILFQIIPINIFLTSNLTNNKTFRYVLRYNFNSLLSNNNLVPRFTKTPWKFLAFFYIYYKNASIYKNKDSFKIKFIQGSYGEISTNIKYQIIPFKYFDSLKAKKNKIYELSMEQIYNNQIPLNLEKVNISIVIDKYDKDIIEKCFDKLYKMNVVPFASIQCKLSEEEILWICKKVIGINVFINNDNYQYYNDIFFRINNSSRKKLIYVTVKEKNIVQQDMLKNLSGVFYYEDI